MNVYLPFTARLPSAYQEVEYIQSSGTQYIDTGYIPGTNTEVETKFSITSFPTDSYIYGCRNSGEGTSRRTFCMGYKNSVQKLYSFVLTNLDSNYEVLSSSTVSLDTRYTTKQNDSSFYVNGVLQGSYPSHSSYTVGYSMYIFSGNIAGSRGNTISVKLYSMSIKDSGTLVRDFVPCYRKSDSVIGLYDLVNNQFYTNSGTGTFSKGNDVTMKILKNAYIGDVWTPGSNTLLYMEFNNNLNDSSGKGVSISGSGIGYEDIGNKKCVKLTSLTGEITGPGNLMASVGTGDFAVSFYIKPVTSNNVPSVFQACNTASPRNGCFMFMGFNPSNFTQDRVAFYVNDTNKTTTSVTCTSLVGSWHHFLFTRYNGVCYGYIDGNSVLTPYSDSTSLSNVGYQWILNRAGHNDQKWQNTGCCMSELIVEKQGWNSSKAIHYFDITKSNYGL